VPQALERVLQTGAEQEVPLVCPAEGPLPPGIAAPLRSPGGETIGAWLFLGDADFAASGANQRFIAAAGEAVAEALQSLNQRGFRLWPSQTNGGSVFKKLSLTSALTLAALSAVAAMWIPVDYKIACECQIQPATRRYVAAPFAGVFEKSLVEPGDLVTSGQVLARMDGKEIRWELASLAAERERVAKSHDVNLAAGKVAAAQIDRLEVDRLEQKRQLLEHRSAHLEIKSPIEGIVLSGDLKRSEGVPLTVGQRLFEIAPLERVVVEVIVPDEEVSLVAAEQEAAIRLDAFGDRAWQGRLQRLHPRSEVRDGQNVFIAEVLLANEGSFLRPGMEGRAKIVTGPQRLGWILFHEPYYRLVGWLGW
jgi:multidrug efflux pump subunit AcrA (membrane-fusion protein)